jgi:hypothetical protein
LAGAYTPGYCRFSIADEHGKELPRHFFNRQSAIVNRQLAEVENPMSAPAIEPDRCIVLVV